MIIGIILAAGKGTRLKSRHSNKVTLPFLNKPLVIYGVELMESVADKTVVVIGAFHQSVKNVLKKYEVLYAHQKKRLGTSHAVKVGLEILKNSPSVPSIILVGYGDHTMFYKKTTIDKLIGLHKKENAVMSIITVEYKNPNSLAWGRIIRDNNGLVIGSVEQKDATEEQKKVTELNAGFYCFDYDFLRKNIGKVRKSPISHEYYINTLVNIAVGQNKKVAALKIPFKDVGIGINQYQELEESQRIYLKTQNSL